VLIYPAGASAPRALVYRRSRHVQPWLALAKFRI
jgi:hypothetical protein